MYNIFDFQQFGLQITSPIADTIGFEDRATDDYSTLLLRRIINQWSCQFGYDKCWNNAKGQLINYLDNKNSEK